MIQQSKPLIYTYAYMAIAATQLVVNNILAYVEMQYIYIVLLAIRISHGVTQGVVFIMSYFMHM